MSRMDGAIVAWHEVPGKAPPRKDRPVGYGVSAFRRLGPLRPRNNSGISFAGSVPYGTVLWRGTLCLATIAPSSGTKSLEGVHPRKAWAIVSMTLLAANTSNWSSQRRTRSSNFTWKLRINSGIPSQLASVRFACYQVAIPKIRIFWGSFLSFKIDLD
jgi:hypothetical protein